MDATLPAAKSLNPIPLEAAMAEAALSIDSRIRQGIFTRADHDWLVEL